MLIQFHQPLKMNFVSDSTLLGESKTRKCLDGESKQAGKVCHLLF